MVNKSCKLWGRTYYADDMFKCGMIDVKMACFEVGDTFRIKSLIPILYQDGKRRWAVEKMNGTYVLSRIIDDDIFLFYDVTTDRTFSIPAPLIVQDLVELYGTNMRQYQLEN